MAELKPELFIEDRIPVLPDIHLVPALEDDDNAEVADGSEPIADVLVNVVIEVDGQPKQLCINISRAKLGNDQPISSFFDRFENKHRNAEGRLVGEFGKAELLAERALHIAERQAALGAA